MRNPLFATILTLSFLLSVLGGLCSSVYADPPAGGDGAPCIAWYDNSSPSDSPCGKDHDQHEHDHCKECCNCSCHTYSHESAVSPKRTSLVTFLVTFEPFSAIPDVIIPKFVPPENFA